MKEDNLIGKDVAQSDFERMRESMGIVEESEVLDAESKAAYAANVDRIVRSIQKGSTVVNENGQPVFTDSKGTVHTFNEPLGGLYLSPQKKNAPEMSAIYQYANELTKGSCSRCATLPMRDIRIVVSIVGLFTAL